MSAQPYTPPASPNPPRRAPLVARDERELHAALGALLPELRGRARRLARDPDVADDLAQDAVERAIRFAAQYERGTNLRAWVHQILFSVFITRYRRAKRDRNAVRALTSDPCAWTHPDGAPSPEVGVSLGKRARAELDALPPAFRQVIQLVDLGDCTYREAADELSVPMGTVMSRLHRGRRLLAEQLREAA
ncbi:MAG: sigma-70 family RNA polymerase sigma factor [Myxococcales bacterium]|nr:sigma-70 family RNA polymerase sigma factor [Myxococcales bacterium]